MKRLTGPELQQYLQFKQMGGIPSTKGGVEKFLMNILEAPAKLGRMTSQGAYQAQRMLPGQQGGAPEYMTRAEIEQWKKNPFMETLKPVAGTAAFFVPAGIGTGAKGLLAGGAVSGGLSGFGAAAPGEELSGALKGAAFGAGTAGALVGAGKGISKLKGKMSTKGISEIKAPLPVKGTMQYRQLETQAKRLGKSIDDIMREPKNVLQAMQSNQIATVPEYVNKLAKSGDEELASLAQNHMQDYLAAPQNFQGKGIISTMTTKGTGRVTSKLRGYQKGRELNAIKRSVGYAPSTKLGGAQLLDDMNKLSKEYSIPINSADDALKLSTAVRNEYGDIVKNEVVKLTEQGQKANIGDVLSNLEKLKSNALTSDKRGIQTVIDDIQGYVAQNGDDVASIYRLKQQLGPKGKWSPVTDPSLAQTAKAYRTAYNDINKGLEKLIGPNFRQANKMVETSIKMKQYAEKNALQKIPGASFNDPLQDLALAGAFVGGGPGAGIGLAGGKVIQSPRFERFLGKLAGKAADITEGNFPKLGMNKVGIDNKALQSILKGTKKVGTKVAPIVKPTAQKMLPIVVAQQITAQTGLPYNAETGTFGQVTQEGFGGLNPAFVQQVSSELSY